MSRGCFASACTSCPDSGRWTGSKRTAPSLLCTASVSSGWSLSFPASSARICRPASPRSPPTGDLATGVLAMLALLTVRIRPLFWLFVVAFNLVGTADLILDYYHAIRVGLPAMAGAVGRRIRNPDHLRAHADDHARRRTLLVSAASAQGDSEPRQRCGCGLDRISAAPRLPLQKTGGNLGHRTAPFYVQNPQKAHYGSGDKSALRRRK